jgi:MFS family permease
MGWIPGGDPVRPVETSTSHITHLWQILEDSNFKNYLGGLGLAIVGSVSLTVFLSLYLKEEMGLPPGTIVLMDIVWMVGGLAASLVFGSVADRVGSKPILIPMQFLCVFVSIGWLLAPRQPNAAILCGILYFVYGAFANGSAIASGRLVFNSVIPIEKNTGYTAIYYAWMGLIGGATPLLAGKLLSLLSKWQGSVGFYTLDAYGILFLSSLVGFLGSALLFSRVRPDGNHTFKSVVHVLFRRLR